MRNPCLRTPRAVRDLLDGALHLSEQGGEALGLRFLARVESTLGLLARRPGFGRQVPVHSPRLEGMRSYRVRGFSSWRIFYLPMRAGIEVVRVLHAAREVAKSFDILEEQG